MRRDLLGGANEAASGAPAPAVAANPSCCSFVGAAPSPAPSGGAVMGMAVSRSVLYCGIGAAALVWVIALIVIVRTCTRQRRAAARSADNRNAQGTAAATKPRKRVFATPLPVLIIQPDRRSLDLGYQEDRRWGNLTFAPCSATQDDKLPAPGSSADAGQFIVEFAEAGVWLPPDEAQGGTSTAGSTRAAGCSPSRTTQDGSSA